jgi:hypothetical protein
MDPDLAPGCIQVDSFKWLLVQQELIKIARVAAMQILHEMKAGR